MVQQVCINLFDLLDSQIDELVGQWKQSLAGYESAIRTCFKLSSTELNCDESKFTWNGKSIRFANSETQGTYDGENTINWEHGLIWKRPGAQLKTCK